MSRWVRFHFRGSSSDCFNVSCGQLSHKRADATGQLGTEELCLQGSRRDYEVRELRPVTLNPLMWRAHEREMEGLSAARGFSGNLQESGGLPKLG